MKLLYVALCVPYKKAYNAGAQTLNYYINELSNRTNNRIDVVSFCSQADYDEIKRMETRIHYHLIVERTGIKNKLVKIKNFNSRHNPFYKYCNLIYIDYVDRLLYNLKRLRDKGYQPDIVFLEWTQIVFLVDKIRDIFPQSRIIASEPDVSFLNIERRFRRAPNPLVKLSNFIRYKNCKAKELAALKKCDYIFTQCDKDVRLMVENDNTLEKKVSIETPYYHQTKIEYNRQNNDIIFFGAMDREENKDAVKWFVYNVMPLISDLPCRFVVIGKGIDEELKKIESDKIIMKGFVESIDDCFSKAMCFVCPLQLGAGIKVKTLEALYSEIPVVSNYIGIEGINPQDGKDYIHAETPIEFAKAIRKIYGDEKKQINGKEFVMNKFSLERSLELYINIISNLKK